MEDKEFTFNPRHQYGQAVDIKHVQDTFLDNYAQQITDDELLAAMRLNAEAYIPPELMHLVEVWISEDPNPHDPVRRHVCWKYTPPKEVKK